MPGLEALKEEIAVSQPEGNSFSAEPKTQAKESPISKLRAGLENVPDNSTLSKAEVRGTQAGNEENQTKAEVDGDSKEESKTEGKTIEAKKTDAPVKDAEKPKIEKGPEVESRYSKDIREAKAKVKELEKQLQEAKTGKPEAPKEYVPKPTPPSQYKTQDLIEAKPKWQAAIVQARNLGDEIQANKLEGELAQIENLIVDHKLHDLRMENWQSQNSLEEQKINQQKAYYENLLTEKMPDLFDPEKPLAKTYDSIENDQTIKDYVNYAKGRPDGKLFLAKLASLTLAASSTDALATELKETKEKLAAMEKKYQPIANSTGANRLEAPGETKQKPISKFRAGLREAGLV